MPSLTSITSFDTTSRCFRRYVNVGRDETSELVHHSESLLAVTKPRKPQPSTSMPSPSRRTWIWWTMIPMLRLGGCNPFFSQFLMLTGHLVSQHAFIVTVHICMSPCPLCPYYVHCMPHAPKYICLICVFVREFTIQCPFVCAFIRPFHDTFRVFYIFLFFLKQTD
jgi:hypothetical protein